MAGNDSGVETCAPDKPTELGGMWYVLHDRMVDKRWEISSTAKKNSGGGTSAKDNPGLPDGIWYMALDLMVHGQRQIASTAGNDSAEQSCSTVKRKEPSGIGKRNMIRRPAGKGRSDQRLWVCLGPRVAR